MKKICNMLPGGGGFKRLSKKAFTLIELLAVIVLLSVISIIAIVTVRKNINNARNSLYNLQIKNIEDGAKNWTIDNIKKIPTGEATYVTLGTLRKGGYVDEVITSPQDDKLCFPNDLKVEIISHQSGKYDYNVLDEEIEYVDCKEQSTHLFSTIAIENTKAKYTTIDISYSLDVVDEEDEDDFDIECLYGTNDDRITNSNGVIVDKENKTCTITNLTPDTKYYFSLNIELYGKQSNKETDDATTKKQPQIATGNATVTTNSITIPYTVINADGVNVRCTYGTDSNDITNTDNVTVDNKNCTITNLSSKTKYFYTLSFTFDDDDFSTTKDATTKKIFPGTYVAASPDETHKGIVYMDPTNLLRECNSEPYSSSNTNGYKSTTGTKSGCMRFYIYKDTGDYYRMILDHNTTARVGFSNTVGLGSRGGTAASAFLNRDTSNWQINSSDTTKIQFVYNISVDDIINVIGKSSSYNTESSFSFKSNKYAWLYNNTYNCSSYSCTNDDNKEYSTIGYLHASNAIRQESETGFSYGYWTNEFLYEEVIDTGGYERETVEKLTHIRVVTNKGSVSSVAYLHNYDYGIRPTVTMYKSFVNS